MKYRWFILILACMLLSACSVTIKQGSAEPDTETPYQESPVSREEAVSEEAAASEDDPLKEELPEESNDAGENDAQDESPETVPEETPDKEHATIPEFDPTPLPGYESIVFVGDSRTLTMASGGTYEFRLVPEDSVEATWGGELTDVDALENARKAAEKHRPKAVFWYGINDVQLNPQRNDAAVFINNYLKVLNAYLEIEPDSTIYILSILDTTVREKDYYQGQEQNIRNYNQALYRLCLEKGWLYIDVSGLLTGDECYEEGDNIHFSKQWYQERFLPYVTVFTGLNIYQ